MHQVFIASNILQMEIMILSVIPALKKFLIFNQGTEVLTDDSHIFPGFLGNWFVNKYEYKIDWPLCRNLYPFIQSGLY